MAKKKKGGGRRGGGDDDSDDDAAPTQQATKQQQEQEDSKQQQQSKNKARKEKRQQKQQAKQHNVQDDDDDDDDGGMAALLSGGAKAKYGSDSDDDSADEVRPPAAAASKKQNKKKKGGRAAPVVDDDDAESSEEPDLKDDDDDDDGGEVEQIAFTLADDDGWGTTSKKKKKDKDKKEKKEKKHKKEKKKKKDKDGSKKHGGGGGGSSSDDDSEHEKEKEDKEKPKDEKKAKAKTKFELQMEAALKKKEAEAEEEEEQKQKQKQEESASQAAATGGKKNKKGASGLKPAEPEPDWIDPNNNKDNGDDNDDIAKGDDGAAKGGGDGDGLDGELMYGAPDDVVWSDKSHAQRAADESGAAGDDDYDRDLHYGPDGKKLSNKERKRVLKERLAAEREAEFQKSAAVASAEGAQFACSQTAVNEKDPQWENSLDINIPSFNISAAGKILFKDATLSIGHGRRYGLIGANGRGKSTLLKMIASRDLKLPPRIDFLYVEQEVVADDTPAVEAVLKADKLRWDLMEEESKLMKAVDGGDESEETIVRLQVVVDELTNMGADAAEAKARRILYGLGFTVDMQTKPTKMFSGGWRMRISLARALFVEPTLLMLDEPTNHLDLNAVIWLDEYLQKWKKTLLVVSHDQDFLNSVCQEVLHIEELKLISYKGNYDSFKKAEKTKFGQHVKAWEKQEKRLRELKKSGHSKTKAQETLKKNTKREAGARNQKKKNQAIATGTEAAEAAELIKRPREYHVKLEFMEVAELSRPVMQVENVHFRYSPKHPVIFDKIDFGIDMDSRICIVGPNGAGKSTLLKLLTGELDGTKGEVKRNPRLRMGIYNQHFVDRLPMGKTPIEHLRDMFEDEDYQSVRNRLGKYGLEGHAHDVTMRDLSGGQKARVVFVELSLQRPHILLLDEPTNNLDIETIDALCDAINAFNGGIVVVTHDQRLIEECDCTLWVVEKQGVTRWDAGFDDYKETILRELEEQVEREAVIRRGKLEAAAAVRAAKIERLASKVKSEKKK